MGVGALYVRGGAEAPEFAEAGEERGNLAEVYSYVKAINRAVHRERTRGNGHKLQ